MGNTPSDIYGGHRLGKGITNQPYQMGFHASPADYQEFLNKVKSQG